MLREKSKLKTHESAELHVRGSATYLDDIAEPKGMVHVAPGYCERAIGTITGIDLDAVYRYPGVVTVLTADDIPGNGYINAKRNEDPILAGDEILFHGQVVFAVVAKTRSVARKAAKLALIEVDAKQPVVDVDAGRKAGELVFPRWQFQRGNPDAAIDSAEHKLNGSIYVGGQEHFYLEGQIAIATPVEDGGMHVLSSTQHPTEVQHAVAAMLDVDNAKVVCQVRRLGGGFGGKESQAAQWAALAALAASKTGHPAKMRLDRDDDMIMTGKRHDYKIDYTAGYDKAGRLSAVRSDLYARCGFSCDMSAGVTDRAMFHADNAYFYPDLDITSHPLKTDTVSNTAFRGFGGPQGMMLPERMMDEIASHLCLDPLDVRKANLYTTDRDVTPYGMQVVDNVALQLIEQLEADCEYRTRRKKVEEFNKTSLILKKGIALTPIKFGISFTLIHLNQAGSLVHIYTDGSVQANHGGTEMGQGLHTKITGIVANEFGISPSRVKVTATATDKVPNTPPTAASAGSDLNGMAVRNACQIIRQRLTVLAAKQFKCAPEQVSFENDTVSDGTSSISFAELAKAAFLARVSLSSTGFYSTPEISWDHDKVEGTPFTYFVYGAACSEVTIDTMTGEMSVDQVDILHDVGKSLNPAIDIGQIEGGFVQGMGWLTTEELVYSDDGRLLTHAPSTYKIPTARDVPEKFTVKLWEPEADVPASIYKSKAVGEPPVMLAISVFSAVYDAIAGLNQTKLPDLNAPATPEAIMKAVASMKDVS